MGSYLEIYFRIQGVIIIYFVMGPEQTKTEHSAHITTLKLKKKSCLPLPAKQQS